MKKSKIGNPDPGEWYQAINGPLVVGCPKCGNRTTIDHNNNQFDFECPICHFKENVTLEQYNEEPKETGIQAPEPHKDQGKRTQKS